ncbi:MAG: hypothetical protein ACT4OY_04000 [Alphaproteobacteria bacterium]
MLDSAPENTTLYAPVETILRYGIIRTHRAPVNIYNPYSEGTICIIVPGFQSTGIRNEANMQFYRALAAQNTSVIAFDYSGTRYTEKTRDKFTFESFVEDTKRVIEKFAPARNHIFVSNSYGINIAARAIEKMTVGLVSAVPAPDFIQKKVLKAIEKLPEKKQKQLRLQLFFKGYYFSESKQGMDKNDIKLTRAFLNSAGKNTNQLNSILEQASYKPPVIIVRNEHDNFSNKLGAKTLHEVFKERGFSCKTLVAAENEHQIKSGTIEKILEAIGDLRQEIALA